MLHHSPLLLPLLSIVFLPVDVTAGSVLSPLKVGSLPSGDRSIRFRLGFEAPCSRLLCFQPRGFAPGERTAPHAPMNAPLLSMLAPIYAWRPLRRHSDSERKHKHDR